MHPSCRKKNHQALAIEDGGSKSNKKRIGVAIATTSLQYNFTVYRQTSPIDWGL